MKYRKKGDAWPTKLLVLGIDGGDWRYINSLLKKRQLPNLKKIIQSGAQGTLKSTIPPTTPTAWTSFFTGLNPANHGIFTWTRTSNGKRTPITSFDIKEIKLWDYLNSQNKKVIINGLPLTYPPAEVKGCMISGWDTPKEASDYIFPPELSNYLKTNYKEIKKNFSSKDFKNFFDYKKYIFNLEKRRVKISLDLMNKLDWEFCFIMFSSTDNFNHFGKQRDVLESYRKIDKNIGVLLKNIDLDQTSIIVISDHGSKKFRKVFYLNKWLQNKGYLRVNKVLTEERLRRNLNKNIADLIMPIWKKVPWIVKTGITHLTFTLLGKTYDINIKKTLAHTNERGEIYLNQKLIKKENKNVKQIKQELREELLNLKDPWKKEKFIEEVIDYDKIYQGKYSTQAPDLYLRFKKEILPRNYLFGSRRIWKDLQKNPDGEHTEKGIIIMKGRGIKRKQLETVPQIYDVFPTILYLMNLPIPDYLDGKVIKESIKNSVIQNNPPVRKKINKNKIKKSKKTQYTPKQKQELENKLKNLGYI